MTDRPPDHLDLTPEDGDGPATRYHRADIVLARCVMYFALGAFTAVGAMSFLRCMTR